MANHNSIHPTDALTILVVDDDKTALNHSLSLIDANGHEADGAISAADAVEAAYRFPYDLIFVELHLSKVNGYETAKAIKSLPDDRGDLPIIGLSQTKDPEDVRRCFQFGMSNFVLKPLTDSSFLATITYYMVKKTNRRQQQNMGFSSF